MKKVKYCMYLVFGYHVNVFFGTRARLKTRESLFEGFTSYCARQKNIYRTSSKKRKRRVIVTVFSREILGFSLAKNSRGKTVTITSHFFLLRDVS